jgi:hypothetical protein
LHSAHLQKQLQTALILSVTFIWFHLWVGLNGLWFMIAFIFPSLPSLPRRQHLHKNFFRCSFRSTSAPRNRCPPQLFHASYAPLDATVVIPTKFSLLQSCHLTPEHISARQATLY